MRRVVVTGLGMVTPLGCGVEPTWSAAARRRERRRPRRRASRSRTSPARSPARSRAATARTAPSIPTQWMEPKEQRKVDPFIVYAMAAAEPGARRRRLAPEDLRGPVRHRRADRLRASAASAASTRRPSPCTSKGPRRISPFFIPGRLINLASRLRLDRARPQGPEPRGRDRLLDRRARHRRRGAADRARRRRRDGGRRHGIARSTASRSPASPPAGRCRRASTTTRPAPRAPTTGTATAS